MRCMAHRYYWTPVKKAGGVYRILCLGDSVLYGQGITFFEALPHQLEQTLNRMVINKEIEVVNLGNSGFSIYDDWLQYTLWEKKFEPDMVILTLSNNDLELYRLPGERHVQAFWDNDSIHLQYFKLIFDDIAAYITANSIPVTVAFFEFNDNLIKHKAWSEIKKLCADYNIDLVNISNGIEKDFLYDEHNLLVNNADGHPSAKAAKKAAEKLAKHIFEKGYLDNYKQPHLSGKELFASLMENARQSLRAGAMPEIVLYRLYSLMTAKLYARNGINDGDFFKTDEFLNIKKQIESIYQDNIKTLFIEAYAQLLKTGSVDIHNVLYNAYILFTRLAKNIFVLKKNLRYATLKYFPYKDAETENINPKIINKISEKLNGWLNDLCESEKRFFAMPTPSCAQLDLFAGDLQARKKESQKTVNKIWDNTAQLINSFIESLSLFNELLEKYDPLNCSEEPHKTFMGIIRDILKVFEELERLIEVLNLNKIKSLTNFGFEPVCSCVAHIKSSATKAQLRIQLDSSVPYYAPIIESHWLIGDGESRSYKFLFPLFTLGKIELIIFGQGNIEFEYLQMYINENRRITLKKENFRQTGDNRFESGMIFNTV